MNAAWQNFLNERGAHIAAGTIVHFGAAAAERRAARDTGTIAPLVHLGLIRCSGEDAQAFLQGQLSNDVNQLGPQQSQYTSYCSPKGRVLANFLLWHDPEGYCLQLAQELQPAIRKRLGMYVMRSRVKLTDGGENRVTLGLSGVTAARALREFFPVLPELAHQLVHDSVHGSLIALPGGRFELVAEIEAAKRLWDKLAKTLTTVGAPCWEWLEIRNGLALIGTSTQDQFVPQMANLELIGAVNFKKGCYPGQEIVARTQYRGQLKRRMILAHVDAQEVPLPGDEIHASDLEGQTAGMVVSAQPAPDGGCDLLAVVQVASAARVKLHLISSNGPQLQIQSLPYPI